MPKRINLALITGGNSNERDISIKTGQQIALALNKEKYNIFLIEISKDNHWFVKSDDSLDVSGKNSLINNSDKDIFPVNKNFFKKIDLAFIALHGKNGEDGRIQALLDLLNVPYTGSGVLASSLGMNKARCSDLVRSFGLLTPKFVYTKKNSYNFNNFLITVENEIGFPCVVKPNESGSSIGISIVDNKEYLEQAINQAFNEDSSVVVEQYIKGREFTCGILGNSGDDKIISLPPVEIISSGSKFFDYDAKYFSENTQEICPANINQELIDRIQNNARIIHEILGCDGLTRSDFILSEDNILYFLEINTIPGQTALSLCPKEAKAIGWSFSEFIEKQIELALKRVF